MQCQLRVLAVVAVVATFACGEVLDKSPGDRKEHQRRQQGPSVPQHALGRLSERNKSASQQTLRRHRANAKATHASKAATADSQWPWLPGLAGCLVPVKLASPALGTLMAAYKAWYVQDPGSEGVFADPTAPTADGQSAAGEQEVVSSSGSEDDDDADDSEEFGAVFGSSQGAVCFVWAKVFGGVSENHWCVRMRPETNFVYFFLDWAVVAVLSFIFAAFFYTRRRITGLEHTAQPERTFQRGHLECCSDPTTCCTALMCPWTRWADTVSMAKFMRFWEAFWLIAFLTLLDYLCGFVVALLLVYWRQKLRKELNLRHGDCPTYTRDCCFAFWCPCCLIAQEARVMNEACRVGSLVSVLGFVATAETEPTMRYGTTRRQ